jgi:hypothetical protein
MPHKNPASERRGGPGSSHDDATKPLPPSENPRAPYRSKQHSQVSGGGGEADVHHDHDPRHKRDFEAGGAQKRQH